MTDVIPINTTEGQSRRPRFALPDFATISSDTLRPLTDALLEELADRWQTLTQAEEYTFEAIVHGHEALHHELMRRWSPISHLNMVTSEDGWQDQFLSVLADITEFSSRLAQDKQLFQAYRAIADQLDDSASQQQRQVLRHALRDFRLAGIDLDEDSQARYRELMQRLSALQTQFANNVQQCADQWQWHTEDAEAVAGLPASVANSAARAAKSAGSSGWLFGLSQPVYQAVISHAHCRETRERFYRAWMTRATDSGEHDPEFDNSAILCDILDARQQLATLLGFDTYADYSLAAKMAGSVDEVVDFLTDLCERSVATAKRDLAALESLAGHTLAPWDLNYYTEQLKERSFAISDEMLRPYFPAGAVIKGLFSLAERLYGLRIKAVDDVPVWHSDVQFLEVVADGAVIGGFYTDLYARAGKRSGAWIDECVVRSALSDDPTLPVGYLVCNFTPPDEETPSLLTHNDVVTLFHEFGHMLHHLLTRIDYPSIAGINGVPWDAVELPSQFMENFAWHFDVLQRCSGHYQTGDSLPRAVFDQLLAARNASSGLQMLRQLEFALFDFRLHANADAATPGVVEQVIAETRRETSLVDVPAFSRFQNSFTHVFAGGYAAGYYSYKWAEVLAADAFSAFDEAGSIFDQTVADNFRRHILEIGGSEDIQRAFVAFRGREPSADALLASSGIEAA